MNKDLREVRKGAMQKSIPSKGRASAKVMGKKCIWLVRETARRTKQLEQRERENVLGDTIRDLVGDQIV